MREFFVILKEIKGLRPVSRNMRNTQFLVECMNVRVGNVKIEPYSIVDNLGITSTTYHPFPQIIVLSDGLYYATDRYVYKIVGGVTYTLLDIGVSSYFNNRWSVADFGPYKVWASGSDVLISNAETEKLSVYPLPYTISSVCNYRGQLIAGGFGELGYNTVAWSEIGNIDISNLLQPNTVKNTSGFVVMSWNGEVYQVKVLGDKVIVYGSGGITALIPYEHTFGRIDLPFAGILGKDAVGGDDRQHLFIDETGKAWKLAPDLSFSELGYSEFLSVLDASCTVSHNKVNGDFYISDGTYCYLASNNGMTRVEQCVSSCDIYSGELVCGNSYNSVGQAYIVTDTIDFESRGIKTITALEIGTLDTSCKASVLYRFSGKQSWQESIAKTVNKNGSVFPIVSGVEFRIKILFPSYSDAEVDYINIRYKNVDKRVVRGTYDANAQASA